MMVLFEVVMFFLLVVVSLLCCKYTIAIGYVKRNLERFQKNFYQSTDTWKPSFTSDSPCLWETRIVPSAHTLTIVAVIVPKLLWSNLIVIVFSVVRCCLLYALIIHRSADLSIGLYLNSAKSWLLSVYPYNIGWDRGNFNFRFFLLLVLAKGRGGSNEIGPK